MNYPKKFFALTTCLIIAYSAQASVPSDSCKKKFIITVNAAFIANESRSHYEPIESQSRWTDKKFFHQKGAPDYLPGYCFGLTTQLMTSPYTGFIFAISASQTRARYQFFESIFNEGTGMTYTTKTRTVNSNLTVSNCNIEAGYNFRFFKKFFLRQTFIVHANILTSDKQQGNITTSAQIYDETKRQHVYNSNTEEINQTVSYNQPVRISARITAGYEFKCRETNFNIFGFGNVALKYKMIWCGLGFSLYL